MTYNIDVTDPIVDQTTDATPKTLTTFSLDPHAMEKVRLLLTALATDDNFKTWDVSGWIRRGSSGSAILYGDLLSILPGPASLGALTWSLDANVSGGDVDIVFTGQSGKTIDLLLIIDLGAKFTP